MSVDAITAVFKGSNASGVDRLVLLVLADVASPDGVSWMKQTTISERARCSEREVRYALEQLRKIGEIEQRVVQRGQSRQNVYRVCVEPVGQTEVDYQRVPFHIEEPFTGLRPAEVAGRRSREVARDGTVRPATVAGRKAVEHVAVRPATSSGRDRKDPAGRDRQLRAGHKDPSVEPSVDPSTNPVQSRTGSSSTRGRRGSKPDSTGPGDVDGFSRLSPSDGLTHESKGGNP